MKRSAESINASGKYVLGNNLDTATASQTAITITAANVILDLNQFYLSGPGNNTASTTPVIRVDNVTIRNGTIANNGYGIYFATGSNSINSQVENLNITRCYIGGIYFAGITTGCVVQNNTITQIGGSTSAANVFVFGILPNSGAGIESNNIIGSPRPAPGVALRSTPPRGISSFAMSSTKVPPASPAVSIRTT